MSAEKFLCRIRQFLPAHGVADDGCSPCSILLVDDDPGSIQLLGRYLAGVGRLRFATNGADAIRLAREAPPDLVLLDAEMPGMSDQEVCRVLKADPSMADIPVVFVTARSEADFEISAFDVGAVDFIVKPISAALVRARVKTRLRVKRLTDELRRLPFIDALTGVANRRRFDDMLQLEWQRGRRSGDPISLLMIDADHFKKFNDHCGHPAGDDCLQSVAQALLEAISRPADLVARFGGEEFTMLLPQTPRGGAEPMAHRVLDAIRGRAIRHAGSSTAGQITVGVGVACYDEASTTWSPPSADSRLDGDVAVQAADLLQAADLALYAAKRAGRARALLLDIADVEAPRSCRRPTHPRPIPQEATMSSTEPRRCWRRLPQTLLALALTFGWAVGAPAAPLTLAIPDLAGYAPALIAEAEGYYAAEGLDLRILHCLNGKRCLEHLTGGEAQLAAAAETPIMFAAHAGKRFNIVATMGTTTRDLGLIVRSDRGIRGAADLKGKRIGFVPGTLSQFFTDTYLLFHGINHASVTLVPLEIAQAAEQLTRGDIDAAGIWQPYVAQSLALLGNKGATLPSPRLFTLSSNIVSQPGVGDADLGKLLRAMRRAVVLIDTQPQRAQTVLARRLKVEPQTLTIYFENYDFKLTLSQSLLVSLESEFRWAQRSALVPAGAPPDYFERFRTGPLRALDPRAVTITK